MVPADFRLRSLAASSQPGHRVPRHATDRVRQLGRTDGRMGDPADFGKVVAFLCSEPAAFINGIALGVDGGAVTGLL